MSFFYELSTLSLGLITLSKEVAKNGPKKLTIFCCILGNHFIGLFNGTLHVLLLLVVPEKLKEMCC